MIEAALDNEIEEDPLKDINDQTIPTTTVYNNKPIEIEPRKVLNINKTLVMTSRIGLSKSLGNIKGLSLAITQI